MPRDPNCTACPLHEGVHTVCLPGEYRDYGAEAAGFSADSRVRVLVVGENPGVQEDERGHPFIGLSGELLEEAFFEAARLPEAFLTNATRCAKGKRALPRASLGACASYLDEEIAAIKPTHILALGAPAFQRMGGHGKISEQAGVPFRSEKYDCWVYPALHPAAILRTPALKDNWMHDLRRFGDLVRGAEPELPPLDWGYCLPGALVSALHQATSITYDFEATPIPWWHRDWVPYSIAFYCTFADAKPFAYVLPLMHPDLLCSMTDIRSFFAAIKDVMQDPAIPKTSWNGGMYDDVVWQRIAGYPVYETCDAMALAHLANENELKGLKWQGMTHLGWPSWDIDIVERFKRMAEEIKATGGDEEKALAVVRHARYAELVKEFLPLDELAKYNAYDVYGTYLRREQLLAGFHADREHGESQLFYFGNLVMPSIRAVGRMVHRGIYGDLDTIDARLAECNERAEEVAARIPVANPGSPKQIGAWLFGQEHLPVLKLTPTGAPSTDEETINRLAQHFPAAKTVLEYRKWSKNSSTYLAPAASMIRSAYDQRAHYDYRSTSVETGRYGSRFHTQPRDPFVRSIFSAPSGWTLLSADSSQLEARLAAWDAAGRPATWEEVIPERATMLCAFRDNRDVYVETAAAVLGKRPEEVTVDKSDPNNERQIMGKVPSLSMIYQISAEGFREYAWKEHEIDFTVAQAEQIHAAFYGRWPEIAAWHALCERLIRLRGYAPSPIGRIRHLPEVHISTDREVVEKAIRSGINAPIQGLASNINDMAHVFLDGYFHALPDPQPYHVGIVHDSNLVQCPDEFVEQCAQAMHIVMTDTVPRLLEQFGVHLPPGLLRCEIQAGPWGAGHEIKALATA